MGKPLTLKTNFKGLKIHCNKCNKDFNGLYRLNSQKPSICLHSESQAYKVFVYVPNSRKKRSKTFVGVTDESEAIKLAIEFKNELKASNYYLDKKEVTVQVRN